MIGYAIVNLQDGTIDTTYSFPLTGSPRPLSLCFMTKGTLGKLLVGLGVRKLVEQKGLNLFLLILCCAVSQLPRFDGESAGHRCHV